MPLFLPLYGANRLRDLRTLENASLGGQNIFDSGWEWGAWLSDVVAAHAAWRPAPSFRAALAPVAKVVGEEAADVVARLAEDQRRLLVFGGGARIGDLGVLSGFGYLSGRTAWTDLLETLGVASTQPGRVNPTDHGHPLYGRVAPLLADMNATFGARAAELAALARTAAEGSAVAELADGARLLAGRAAFVAHIYAAQAPDATATAKAAALGGARAALDAAAAVVARRERHYRVDAARVGGWRDTPTAYGFGYLWTVKTLFYWWRDLGKAIAGVATDPCYLNEENALEVAFGADWAAAAGPEIRAFLAGLGADKAAACFSPPPEEYAFPRDLFRY